MRPNQKGWKTSAHSWLAVVLSSALLALTACGGAVEDAPAVETPVSSGGEVPGGADGAVRPEGGPGHGCPTAAHECREYCVAHGKSSGHCSGYGRGSCVCVTTQ